MNDTPPLMTRKRGLCEEIGCYAMTAEEIRLSQAQHKQHPATDLEADGVTFLLGQRAQPFIQKYFLSINAPE